MNNHQIQICSSPEQFGLAKRLTKDYMDWLGMDLCFQAIDKELDNFSAMYGAPDGCFLYISYEGRIAGGVGCRRLTDDICEMKRLFLYQEYKGKGLGKILCNAIIQEAQNLGYQKMRLDTVEKLHAANRLYESLGFHDIEPYNYNPDETVRYMELAL